MIPNNSQYINHYPNSYTKPHIGLAERDLLYIANLLISSKIHVQTLTRSGKKRFTIHQGCDEDMEFVRLLVCSNIALDLEQGLTSSLYDI